MKPGGSAGHEIFSTAGNYRDSRPFIPARPIPDESSPGASNDRGGLHDLQTWAPTRPESRQQNPQHPVGALETQVTRRVRWENGSPSKSTRMKIKRQFSDNIVATLQKSKGLRIRAGTGRHRFIGIWFVVVNERVFVRSWSAKPQGWYRTFRKEPRGAVQVAGHKIPVRAVAIGNKTLRNAIDLAYLEKYNTPGARRYAKDLGSAKSRATTLELVPLAQNH